MPTAPWNADRPRYAGPVQRHAGGGLEGDTDRPCIDVWVALVAAVHQNMPVATELQQKLRVFFRLFWFFV